jgi:hypothetical protein
MWEEVATIVREFKVSVQAVLDDDDPDDWSPWFVIPNSNYGEVKNYGPFSLTKLKVLRIRPVEIQRIGNRLPPKELNHTESIVKALVANKIVFEQRDGLILIPAAIDKSNVSATDKHSDLPK